MNQITNETQKVPDEVLNNLNAEYAAIQRELEQQKQLIQEQTVKLLQKQRETELQDQIKRLEFIRDQEIAQRQQAEGEQRQKLDAAKRMAELQPAQRIVNIEIAAEQ